MMVWKASMPGTAGYPEDEDCQMCRGTGQGAVSDICAWCEGSGKEIDAWKHGANREDLRNQTLRDAAPVKPTDEHGFSDEERAHLEENLGHRPQYREFGVNTDFPSGQFEDEAWQNKLAGEPMEIAWQLLKGKKPDPRLKAAGVSGYNKPKRTPNHPKKSHIVVARSGGKTKTIRFGQKGAKTVTEDNPKGKRAKKQDSFKARHAKNIKRGPMSAAYWANKVKW